MPQNRVPRPRWCGVSEFCGPGVTCSSHRWLRGARACASGRSASGRICASMPISLLRRERRFYELFDRQAGNVLAASQLLIAAFEDDIAAMPAHQAAIKALEHAGDEVTHEIIQTLHRTFITPFDREDIYALSSGLDDVLDYIDEIAETIILYGITEI